jgi:hypothetical protein
MSVPPAAASFAAALALLPRTERRILTLRYGLDGRQPCSLAAVATRLHRTPGQVRWLEALALKRLQLAGIGRRRLMAERLRAMARHPQAAAAVVDYARALVPDAADQEAVQDAVSAVLVAIYEGHDPAEALSTHRRTQSAVRYKEVPLRPWQAS